MKQAQAQPTTPASQEFDAAKFVQEVGTKSAAIRRLTAEGKTRSEVAKMLGIRYQHVRNVLITPIKKEAVKK